MSLSTPNARAYLALSLAALFEVGLFADSLYERWENVIAPMNQPAAIFMTFGSTIIYYSTVEVTMAHGLGTVATAALAWCS